MIPKISPTAKKEFETHVLSKGEITTYDQIHDAIANCLDGKASTTLKGNLFETFVQAMLISDPVILSKLSDIFKPGKNANYSNNKYNFAIKKLKIHNKDNGIDLILVNNDETVSTVQAKFLSDKSKSVTYSDVATFYDQSKNAETQFLVTSGASIDPENRGSTSDKRKKITYTELQALPPDEIKKIVKYIRTGNYKPKRHKTRPDQDRAIANLLNALNFHSRMRYISACGTGKTFVSARLTNTYDKLTNDGDGGDVVVFVPSLNLMKQTLGAWATEFSNRSLYSFQAICSDGTIANEVTRTSDLQCATTTDVETIRAFLSKKRAKGELRVTFCTYHSSTTLAEAIKGLDFDGFKIGILDEAHHTAIKGEKSSVHEKHLTVPLSKDRIPIDKMISMTATQRIRQLKKENNEEDTYEYSMDNIEIYGVIAHEYKFAEAIKDKVILPVKIIISAILQKDVKQYQKACVIANGKEISFEEAARALTIKMAAEETNAKNIVTFQSSTDRAVKLANLIQDTMTDWNVTTVNGKMPSKQRSENLSIFNKDKLDETTSIVTNCKVMTEGVDIPNMEMAVFIDNKDSSIEIIQIAGRVMRTYPNKECGYVVMPVIIMQEEEESIADAAERSDYSNVFRVINALASEDEELEAVLNEYKAARGSKDETRQRNALNALKGRIPFKLVKGDDTNIADYLVNTDIIERILNIKIVDRIVQSWRERCEETREFYKENNRFPTLADAKVKTLYYWLRIQRMKDNKKELNPDILNELNKIGNWNEGKVDNTQERLNQLKTFYKENDRFPTLADAKVKTLYYWLQDKRKKEKENSLNPDILKELNKIGNWNEGKVDNTQERINQLKTFVKKNNRFPTRADAKVKTLYYWLHKQKTKDNENNLNPDILKELNKIGNWNEGKVDNTQERINQLKTFVKKNNRFPTSTDAKTNTKMKILYNWLKEQRKKDNKKELNPDILNKLNKIGNWNEGKVDNTQERINQLKTFYEENGRFPTEADAKANPKVKKLYTWLSTQRTKDNKKELNPDILNKLNKIGNWNERKVDNTQERLNQLKTFIQENDRFPTEANAKANPKVKKLYTWLSTQRTKDNKKELNPDILNKLNKIGNWNPRKNK